MPCKSSVCVQWLLSWSKKKKSRFKLCAYTEIDLNTFWKIFNAVISDNNMHFALLGGKRGTKIFLQWCVCCILISDLLIGRFAQINTGKRDRVYIKEKVVCHNGNVFLPWFPSSYRVFNLNVPLPLQPLPSSFNPPVHIMVPDTQSLLTKTTCFLSTQQHAASADSNKARKTESEG